MARLLNSILPTGLRTLMAAPEGGDRRPQGSGGPGGPGGQGGPGGPITPQQRGRRQIFPWLVFAGLLTLLIVAFSSPLGGQKEMSWLDFMNLVKAKSIDPESVVVDGSQLTAKVKPNVEGWSTAKPQPIMVNILEKQDYVVRDLEAAGIPWKATKPSFWPMLLINILPVLVIIGVIWFIARSMRGAGGGPGGMLGSFGKSRHRLQTKDQVKVTFADVAGVDEAKDEVQEIVEFLKHPEKFSKLGGRIPRGVLLSGPPGCGKTLLAKAIAGEADVPFFSISGSDFVEMFVGVGASRVRDLFKQAKENAPCISFLDEIDAVGRRRGGGYSSGGHDEREQTLNAILVEMDGFDASTQVIVIASTNRSDVLDPALTRPGRFDRQVTVNPPDVVGRRQILGVHAKKVKLAPDVDLERLARGTPMFSGADLAALINEAAIIAAMANKDAIEMLDLEEARDKVRWGRAKKSRKIEEQERIATAYHEAGHAVVQMLLPDADPLHKVTIIPRGQALGVTFSLPEKDRLGYGRKFCEATMRVLCGGRIAEERKTGDVTSGAGMDIKMVTRMARAMVLDWGMSSKLGFVSYTGEDSQNMFLPEKDYSPETNRVIDEEIRRLSDEAFTDTRRIVDENWDKIVAVAEGLLRYETLQRDDVDRLMRGEPLSKPTARDLLEAEARKSRPAPAEQPPASEPDADGLGGALPSPA
ncbi:MAG: ATP-dependent zinc metalloprotease FtsH [Planctomycetota bacterium]